MMRCIAFTGFLGSGKTTAILKVAEALGARNERVAIVENERGAIGVDGPYLESQGLGVREISDTCVCCDIQSKDRKSTRLNSSHANISYAVFCLKKKTTPTTHTSKP